MDRTVETSPLTLRAELGAVDTDARTIDLVFSTGAAVDRYDYRLGEYFVETLSLDPAHVRLARANAGASVLDAHHGWSIRSVIGGIVPDSVKLAGKRMTGRVLMSANDDVAPILRNIKDKIVRFASVGYQVYQYRDTGKTDKRGWRILEAIDWEPFEVSFVPVPADFLAQTRASDTATRVAVPVSATPGGPTLSERSTMEPTNTPPAAVPPPAPVVETRSAPAPAPVPPAAAPPAAAVATIGQIRTMATSVGLSDADALQLAERAQAGSLTIEAVRSTAIDMLAERHAQTAPAPGAGRVTVGADADDKFQRGVSAWLIQRMGLGTLLRQAAATNLLPAGTFETTNEPGEFRGMTLIDIARECLERRGIKTRGMNRDAIAGAAFTMRRDVGGLMSPGDFPTLLENVLHKILQAGYATQPDTWSKWCKRGSVTDFRAHNRYRMSSFSSLDALTPSGEFKNKALGDAEKASITAGTKGNIIGVNRQLMVNDDLGALTDLAAMLGRAAMLTVEVDAYALLALNAGLGPTVLGAPLFDATHANITTGAALSAAALDVDAAAMSLQKDPSGNEVLDLQPAVLLVARGLKGQANVINASEFDPDNIAAGSKATLRPNVSRGLFREIVGTPRLTGTRRYLFADPNVAPVIEVAFLEGQEAPVLESKDGWRFDGAEMRVRLDYGTAGVDFRGAVTNAGV